MGWSLYSATYQQNMFFLIYSSSMIHTIQYTALPGDGWAFGTRGRVRMTGCPFLGSVKRFLPPGILSPPHPRLPLLLYIVLLFARLFTISLPVMATAVSRTHRWQQHPWVCDYADSQVTTTLLSLWPWSDSPVTMSLFSLWPWSDSQVATTPLSLWPRSDSPVATTPLSL